MSKSMNLKKFRTEMRLTQQAVAERLGVSQQTIARWETNGADIPTKHLKDLAVLIGCSIGDLLDKSRQTLRSEDDAGVPYGTLLLRFLPTTLSYLYSRKREESSEEVVCNSELDRYFPRDMVKTGVWAV